LPLSRLFGMTRRWRSSCAAPDPGGEVSAPQPSRHAPARLSRRGASDPLQ
jgi:hypothetical protein